MSHTSTVPITSLPQFSNLARASSHLVGRGIWAGLGAAPNLAGGRSYAHLLLMGAVVEMPQVNENGGCQVHFQSGKQQPVNYILLLILKLVLYMLAVFTADSSAMKAHMMTASTRKV